MHHLEVITHLQTAQLTAPTTKQKLQHETDKPSVFDLSVLFSTNWSQERVCGKQVSARV